MHRLSTSFILGYHGCSRNVGERLLAGEPFQPSNNEYDWLGPGIYFWESNPALYPSSGFYAKTHVQIVVRNPSCIKGVFRVPPDRVAAL